MTERTQNEHFVLPLHPDATGHSLVLPPLSGGKTVLLNVVNLAFMRNPSIPSASKTATVE